MLRYAITNLSGLVTAQGLNPPATRQAQWRRDLERWSAAGIDFVQLREKNLDPSELLSLSVQGMHLLRNASAENNNRNRPKLLINTRADVAAAARADGVHLTARPGELTPEQVRAVFRAAGVATCVVSVSCHTPADAEAARRSGADLVLFGPVFEKRVDSTRISQGTGLNLLRKACSSGAPLPVLGLGGITSDNTASCLEAGAAGIAGIRFFAPDATLAASQSGVRK